jgi:hypothetical protein
MKPGGAGASCGALPAGEPDCLLTADVMFNVDFLQYRHNPGLTVKPEPKSRKLSESYWCTKTQTTRTGEKTIFRMAKQT